MSRPPGRPATGAWRRSPGPTAVRCMRRASATAPSSRRRRGPGGSATTRSSSPRVSTGPWPSSRTRRRTGSATAVGPSEPWRSSCPHSTEAARGRSHPGAQARSPTVPGSRSGCGPRRPITVADAGTGAPMSDPRHRGQQLRAFFVLLAMIFLVGAGVAYGVTRYLQSELEADATRDARRLSLDVLQPLLVTADAQGPVRGVRYDELLAAVDERVLAGPINGVLLLAQDGTVLFADQPALVGDHQPALRDDIHAVISGASRSSVDDDRFRTLTVLEIGSPPTLVAAELVRSHPTIVEESREVWYPWVGR